MLANCPYGTEYLPQMRDTVARLGTLDSPALSDQAREQLLAACHDWRSA